MPTGNGAPAPIDEKSLELRIGAAARVARRNRDVIHAAMRDGELPFHRDAEGHRATRLGELLAWMGRSQAVKVAA